MGNWHWNWRSCPRARDRLHHKILARWRHHCNFWLLCIFTWWVLKNCNWQRFCWLLLSGAGNQLLRVRGEAQPEELWRSKKSLVSRYASGIVLSWGTHRRAESVDVHSQCKSDRPKARLRKQASSAAMRKINSLAAQLASLYQMSSWQSSRASWCRGKDAAP